jgi:hypothetical protein
MNTFVFCKKLKEMYGNSCNEFAITEIEEATVYYFIPMLFGASCILYFKNNKNILSEILFQVCYKSFLAATKLSNACKRIRNFFISPTSIDITTKAYIYDEVKVIKDGVRCASFETMQTFKDSHYLGNPNEYYDLNEDVEDSSSSSFDSDLVSSSSPSSSSPSSSCSPSPCSSSPSLISSSSSEDSTTLSEPLYIIDKNEDDTTVEFKNFDFIMHTNYKYPESSETMKQNYTKIFRTFTNEDYNSDNTKYEVSTCEMIICTLRIGDNIRDDCSDDDSNDNNSDHECNEEYEIDLQKPYNFDVVGNFILDEKFVHWYMFKKYNYRMKHFTNYQIKCITKDIKLIQLNRHSGLCVRLNDYQQVKQNIQ